ncbi:hypothetical protein OLP40_07740 [Campylobacter jejuni]|nr:hypothetical protein C414_000440031 [Campylobacter jejuni subsp. jejuni 414]MCW1334041.1 hypothetical protein [Campylobacter jejuni]MCW1359468.1 hypothetical protein [Campylobacter jejuni]HDZ4932066.1 hypothetical protein [Campylobacter jejuni]HDZ4936840.1 hypothetical protein [Campylobacter jejuni]
MENRTQFISFKVNDESLDLKDKPKLLDDTFKIDLGGKINCHHFKLESPDFFDLKCFKPRYKI